MDSDGIQETGESNSATPTTSVHADANGTSQAARAEQRTGGDDVVCFTAGVKGAAFQAGTIHAYFAADRLPPAIAAGISVGALSTAALQRCYRELETSDPEDLETRRWRWFRRYLDAISHKPLEVFWRAFPDPDDILSNKLPVRDTACPEILLGRERKARRNYYLLTRLGSWLFGLPVTVRRAASLIVSYVRAKERYWGWPLFRWVPVGWHGVIAASQVIRHVALAPRFVPGNMVESTLPRPLLGWRAWIFSLAAVSGAFFLLLRWVVVPLVSGLPFDSGLTASLIATWHHQFPWLMGNLPSLVSAASVVLALALLASLKSRGLRRILVRHISGRLEIRRGWLYDYHLHRRLLKLFTEEGNLEPSQEPALSIEPFPVLLVAACLEDLGDTLDQEVREHQLWARDGFSLITALRAALALPTLFPPVRLEHRLCTMQRAVERLPTFLKKKVGHPVWADSANKLAERSGIAHWISESRLREAGHWPDRIDLVDGSVIRKNPIPALFAYLRREGHREMAERLAHAGDPDNPSIHVVYSVPVKGRTPTAAERTEELDIIDSAKISSQLASRRDTKMERRQTNFISGLEQIIRRQAETPPQSSEDPVFPIFAGDIAPEREISYRNTLAPEREESLAVTAEGCRRTLEALYAARIRKRPQKLVPCSQLLSHLAPRRNAHISRASPGLSEVCQKCSCHLRSQPEMKSDRPPGVFETYGKVEKFSDKKDLNLATKFPNLTGAKPRIVFVASGGVFRGATHIGVLAALRSANVRPDLIVGASVGTLIGGALGAISTLGEREADEVLVHLTDGFLRVDETVALTATLKRALRQLAVRFQGVRLSPRRLRRLIRRGTRSDPGFAATGAPPDLIDAISEMFLLPNRVTSDIAAEFVAGNFTKAINRFLSELHEEALERLGVKNALIGTALLEPFARRLLRPEDPALLGQTQPFEKGQHPIAFFGTATSLGRRQRHLLGRDFFHLTKSYDFVEAALSSSAFPAVFSPRREADVLPGCGMTDELFADGGMFDNLPFFPALEVLADIQTSYRRQKPPLEIDSFLRTRFENPDLFIAASLDAKQQGETKREFVTRREIKTRAGSLKKNLKLESFDEVSRMAHAQLKRLVETYRKENEGQLSDEDLDLLDGVVAAGVLQIIPDDDEHINPTFAFSATLGLRTDRVQRAIAHGCFKTLEAFEVAQSASPAEKPVEISVQALTPGRIKEIRRANTGPKGRAVQEPADEQGESVTCPYFTIGGDALECPFAAAKAPRGDRLSSVNLKKVRGVYLACRADDAHA